MSILEHESYMVSQLVAGLDWQLLRAPGGELHRMKGWAHPDSITAIRLDRAETMLRTLADRIAEKRRQLIGNQQEAA